MAKLIFMAGGITAQDFSFARLVVAGTVNDPTIAEHFEDSPPEGILDRLDAATLITATTEQALIVQLLQQVADLQEQIDALTNPPTPPP